MEDSLKSIMWFKEDHFLYPYKNRVHQLSGDDDIIYITLMLKEGELNVDDLLKDAKRLGIKHAEIEWETKNKEYSLLLGESHPGYNEKEYTGWIFLKLSLDSELNKMVQPLI